MFEIKSFWNDCLVEFLKYPKCWSYMVSAPTWVCKYAVTLSANFSPHHTGLYCSMIYTTHNQYHQNFPQTICLLDMSWAFHIPSTTPQQDRPPSCVINWEEQWLQLGLFLYSSTTILDFVVYVILIDRCRPQHYLSGYCTTGSLMSFQENIHALMLTIVKLTAGVLGRLAHSKTHRYGSLFC